MGTKHAQIYGLCGVCVPARHKSISAKTLVLSEVYLYIKLPLVGIAEQNFTRINEIIGDVCAGKVAQRNVEWFPAKHDIYLKGPSPTQP